jgi:hypothetical protein
MKVGAALRQIGGAVDHLGAPFGAGPDDFIEPRARRGSITQLA